MENQVMSRQHVAYKKLCLSHSLVILYSEWTIHRSIHDPSVHQVNEVFISLSLSLSLSVSQVRITRMIQQLYNIPPLLFASSAAC